MTALIKNRFNYDLMDTISTTERNKHRARLDILMYAMSRYNFSKDHSYISPNYKTTIIYDNNLEIIFNNKGF